MRIHPTATMLTTFLLGLFCSLFVLSPASAKIIEKETVRYFTFEESEYPLDADGRLSDASAREILRRVKRIYESVPPLSKQDYASLCDIRDNLHRVYAGEVYEEILFICIKTVANYAVYLQQPPRKDELPKRQKDTETVFYGGRMLRVTTKMDDYESKGGRFWYYMSFRCTLIERQYKGEVFFKNRSPRWDIHAEPQEYAVEIAKVRPKFEKDLLPELLDEAAVKLAEFIESFIATLYKNGNHRSVLFEEQWNPVLNAIPRTIWERAAKDQPRVSRTLASRLTTTCLQYMTSNDQRAKLKSFAKQAGLDFVEPRVTEEKPF